MPPNREQIPSPQRFFADVTGVTESQTNGGKTKTTVRLDWEDHNQQTGKVYPEFLECVTFNADMAGRAAVLHGQRAFVTVRCKTRAGDKHNFTDAALIAIEPVAAAAQTPPPPAPRPASKPAPPHAPPPQQADGEVDDQIPF